MIKNKKIAIIIVVILSIFSLILAFVSYYKTKKINYILEHYVQGTAYVDSISRKENNNDKQSYYDYTFFYIVNDKNYTGGETNVEHVKFELLNGEEGILNKDGEQLYGDFPIFYNPENPEEYFITVQSYPYALYVFTAFMFISTGVVVFINRERIFGKKNIV